MIRTVATRLDGPYHHIPDTHNPSSSVFLVDSIPARIATITGSTLCYLTVFVKADEITDD